MDIFYKAKAGDEFVSFLRKDTALPMMFMDDAIRATLELMSAPIDSIKIRSAYNLAGVSFTPQEIAESIKKIIPSFTVKYSPDFRQDIADSWPNSIDDTNAQEDWNWKHAYDLDAITSVMLKNVDGSVD